MNMYYYNNPSIIQPIPYSQQQQGVSTFGQIQQFQPFSGLSQPQSHSRIRAQQQLPNVTYMNAGFGSPPKSAPASFSPPAGQHHGVTNSLVTAGAGAIPVVASPTTPYNHKPGLSTIGAPHDIVSGPFAGRTIRAELEEVQKADLGRKCADPPRPAPIQAHLSMQNIAAGNGAFTGIDGRQRTARKDRRPLDPPPVVALRLYEVFNAGTDRQVERRIPTDEIDIDGFVAHADLFSYKTSSNDPRVFKSMSPTNTIGKQGSRRKQMPSVHTTLSQHPLQDHASYAQAPPAYDFTFSAPDSLSKATFQESGQGPNSASSLSMSTQSPTDVSTQPFTSINIASQQAVLASYPRLDSSRIREESKLTSSLFGTSYTHAVSMLDMQGEKVIYFVFSDLAVKLEGLFFLRYRFVDLSSILPPFTIQAPVMAETVGGVFAVYSTKEFPGLKASTDLTKHLSRWGIRVNIRETERKRKSNTKSVANSARGAGGRKRKSYDDQNEDESDGGSDYEDD